MRLSLFNDIAIAHLPTYNYKVTIQFSKLNINIMVGKTEEECFLASLLG